ncbi:hypothetical protein QJS66_10200 [Kocuria rhizophila]|nr:hypothetical protein QJS66_10200 [Kocuria rhizophila]
MVVMTGVVFSLSAMRSSASPPATTRPRSRCQGHQLRGAASPVVTWLHPGAVHAAARLRVLG